MSKSKGNRHRPPRGDGPYGTDAFRFTLAALAAQGRDIRCRRSASRAIATSPTRSGTRPASCWRTWTATIPRSRAGAQPSTVADRWIKSRLAATIKRAVRKALDALPLQRGRLRRLPVPLARVLRLVPRVRQAPACTRPPTRSARAVTQRTAGGDARGRRCGCSTRSCRSLGGALAAAAPRAARPSWSRPSRGRPAPATTRSPSGDAAADRHRQRHPRRSGARAGSRPGPSCRSRSSPARRRGAASRRRRRPDRAPRAVARSRSIPGRSGRAHAGACGGRRRRGLRATSKGRRSLRRAPAA